MFRPEPLTRLVVIFFALLPGDVFKGFSDECLCVVKTIQIVHRKFNVTGSPVSDLGNVSGKRNRGLKFLGIGFHPDPKPALLQVCAAEYGLVQ
jgi:hypothetical protein